MSLAGTVPQQECWKCKAISATDKKFCGDCGALLDPTLGAINAYLDANLKSQLEEVVKQRFKDQRITEIEIAANAAEKLSGWVKLFGIAVGIPLAAIAVILAMFGIRQYSDFIKGVNQAQEGINQVIGSSQQAISDSAEKIESNKKAVDGVTHELQLTRQRNSELTNKLKEDRTAADNAAREVSALLERTKELNTQLAQIPKLTKTVSDLSEKVAKIEGRGAEFVTTAISEGKAVGIDVSSHSGAVDWNKVRTAGVTFAFIKATEGINFRDPKFKDYWDESKTAGIVRGAYHFWRHGDDPKKQAQELLSTVYLGPGDLPLAVDFESTPGGFNPSSPDEFKTDLLHFKEFLRLIEAQSGCKPIIVTGSFWKQISVTVVEEFKEYPLWEFHYGSSPGPFPPWSKWTFWAVSDAVSVNGLPRYDVNIFNGSPAELRDFIRENCGKPH
jgi:lysozyme